MANKRKRSNGEGSVYPEGGKWVAQIQYWKDGELTKVRRKCKKHADAIAKLVELRSLAPTIDLSEQNHTVGSYLNLWLGDQETTRHEPNTFISYRSTINNYLIPQLGRVKLSELKATKIRQAIANIQKAGTGSRAVELAYVVLNVALNQAVADDVIIKNPCISIKKPAHTREECIPYTKEERDAIFEEAKGDYFEPLYRIMLATGIRSSEAFGLHWEDVDFKTGTIKIKQQYSRQVIKKLKSKHSVRVATMTAGIREMLEIQRKQMIEKGFQDKPQVFCGKRGAYLDVINFGKKNWTPLQERAGIEPRGLHHLRHTFATELLNNDVPVHVVSRLLGHGSPTVTFEYYAHVIPDKRSEAVAKIEQIFG